jgi:hypothetical protein
MPDYDRRPTTVVNNSGSSASYFLIGALVVTLLIGAYVLIGAPGLHRQVANAPGQSTQKVDITVQQPAKTAPATPAAPAAPAPARQ